MAFGRWLFATLILSALLLSQGREKRVTPLPSSQTQVVERRHGSVGVAILVGVGKYCAWVRKGDTADVPFWYKYGRERRPLLFAYGRGAN
jgi:hypothetical protein